ncbi:hypothetical protein Ddye_000720, partial [Dipteronia dyeriana]
ILAFEVIPDLGIEFGTRRVTEFSPHMLRLLLAGVIEMVQRRRVGEGGTVIRRLLTHQAQVSVLWTLTDLTRLLDE